MSCFITASEQESTKADAVWRQWFYAVNFQVKYHTDRSLISWEEMYEILLWKAKQDKLCYPFLWFLVCTEPELACTLHFFELTCTYAQVVLTFVVIAYKQSTPEVTVIPGVYLPVTVIMLLTTPVIQHRYILVVKNVCTRWSSQIFHPLVLFFWARSDGTLKRSTELYFAVLPKGASYHSLKQRRCSMFACMFGLSYSNFVQTARYLKDLSDLNY